MLFNWPKYLPQIAPSRGEISTAFNTWFFGPTRLSLPNGISIDSSISAGLMNVTNKNRHIHRQTDHAALLLRCGLKIVAQITYCNVSS